LDDLDKELNTYSMRCREWYGWHFPEMSKLIPDHVAFAKVVRKMRQRTNAATTSLSDILPEEMEEEVKQVRAWMLIWPAVSFIYTGCDVN
jgi:nucleolar protein 58